MLNIHPSRETSQLPTFTPIGLQRVRAIWFPDFLEGLNHHDILFHTAVLACADENGDAQLYSDHEFMKFIELHQSELEQFINDAKTAPQLLTLSLDLPPYPLLVHYDRPKPGHSVILCNRYLREQTLPDQEEQHMLTSVLSRRLSANCGATLDTTVGIA